MRQRDVRMQIKIKLRLNSSRWKLSRNNDALRLRTTVSGFHFSSFKRKQFSTFPVEPLGSRNNFAIRDTSRILETRDISEICKMVNGKRKLSMEPRERWKGFVEHTSTSGNELFFFELPRSRNISQIFNVTLLLYFNRAKYWNKVSN